MKMSGTDWLRLMEEARAKDMTIALLDEYWTARLKHSRFISLEDWYRERYGDVAKS